MTTHGFMWVRVGSWVRNKHTGDYLRRWRGGKLRNRAETITATTLTATTLTATMLKDES